MIDAAIHTLVARQLGQHAPCDWPKTPLQRLGYPDAEHRPKRLRHWANR